MNQYVYVCMLVLYYEFNILIETLQWIGCQMQCRKCGWTIVMASLPALGKQGNYNYPEPRGSRKHCLVT